MMMNKQIFYKRLYIFLVQLGVSFHVFAECPDWKTLGNDPVESQMLMMPNGVRLSLFGNRLKVESLGEIYYYSVKQFGRPASSLMALSSTHFVVFGWRTSFLGVMSSSFSKREDLMLTKLPDRYVIPCDFWEHFWDSCLRTSARYSRVLDSVVISGWERKGVISRLIFGDSVSTLLVDRNGVITPLERQDGTPLQYFGEDIEGNGILVSKDGEEFRKKNGSDLVLCDVRRPLLQD